MHENVVLVAFAGAVLLAGCALHLFFRRFRQHKATTHRLTRLIAGNALVLLFLSSVLVLAGEVYFRYFCDTTDSFGLSKLTARWFQRHFERNNASFRDSVPYTIPIPDGKRRITFLGDSFTAGHGVADVEHRFVNRVRQARADWDVQALAQCGWDTGDELLYVESSRSFHYPLDVVVLVYCLNDVADIAPEWQAVLQRIHPSSEPGFLVQHSYLVNTFYYRWKASRDPDIADYYRFVARNYEGPVWEWQRQRLRRLRDEVAARNGRLIVVTFPFLHALEGDYRYRHIHDRLDEFWRSLDVPHLDLLSVYPSDEVQSLVVNRRDAHPNERAHALAAHAIVEFLDAQVKQGGAAN